MHPSRKHLTRRKRCGERVSVFHAARYAVFIHISDEQINRNLSEKEVIAILINCENFIYNTIIVLHSWIFVEILIEGIHRNFYTDRL